MNAQTHLSSISSTTALQRLFMLQEYSLARYAAQAALYGRDEAQAALEAINSIAHGQSERAAAIGSLLTQRREPVEHRGFPLRFTSLNFVSAQHVAKLLFDRQPQLIREVETCIGWLADDPQARSLAQAVLDGETANLDTLRHVVTGPEAEPHALALAA